MTASEKIIIGTEENNRLFGSEGDDLIYADQGNDQIYAGKGKNTYVFDADWGHDLIGVTPDQAVDNIVFLEGVQQSDLTLSRAGIDLIITHSKDNSVITVQFYFQQASEENTLINIQFANGEVWRYPEISARILQGSENNDYLQGFAGADEIHALGGNDIIYGDSGDDRLFGGAGNDYIVGQEGNDHLYGGENNDQLDGGEGDDTYYFNRGDGIDLISEYGHANYSNIDSIVFGEGIVASDLTYQQEGNDLLIQIAGTSDQLTLSGYFYQDVNADFPMRIEMLKFQNGEILHAQDITNIFSPLTSELSLHIEP